MSKTIKLFDSFQAFSFILKAYKAIATTFEFKVYGDFGWSNWAILLKNLS